MVLEVALALALALAHAYSLALAYTWPRRLSLAEVSTQLIHSAIHYQIYVMPSSRLANKPNLYSRVLGAGCSMEARTEALSETGAPRRVCLEASKRDCTIGLLLSTILAS